jgi:hypothetical protein
VTPAQWRLANRILQILAIEVGRTDSQLADRLGVEVADLRPIVGVLYRQRKLDRCWDYVVIAPRPAGQEVSAA